MTDDDFVLGGRYNPIVVYATRHGWELPRKPEGRTGLVTHYVCAPRPAPTAEGETDDGR